MKPSASAFAGSVRLPLVNGNSPKVLLFPARPTGAALAPDVIFLYAYGQQRPNSTIREALMKANRLFSLVLVALPGLLRAHDTWLVPASFYASPGEQVRVRLATSEAFPTSDGAVSPDRVVRFTLRTGSGTAQVGGYRVGGKDLIADVVAPAAGSAIVAAETKPRTFPGGGLEAKIFNQYLQGEQLTAVIEARALRDETDKPGRERYRKIAKAVICVGDATDSLPTQPEGLWLEIVPRRTPCGLRVGDALTATVLFEGKPLEGVHLAAGFEGTTGHKYPVWLRTDGAGQATVRFDRPGAWFLRTLHMVPAKDDPEADWHSAFTTLVFEVRPR